MASAPLDFSSFPIGAAITLGDVVLVRSDYRDKMKAFSAPDLKLMIVSQDSKGHSLVAIDGDFSHGALQVDGDNNATGYWMPATQWEQLCPHASISIGDKVFVHYDVLDRITTMATESKQLHVVTPNWHGYQLMADEGDLSRGLLMVDSDNSAVGYWMPKEEYDKVVPRPPTSDNNAVTNGAAPIGK